MLSLHSQNENARFVASKSSGERARKRKEVLDQLEKAFVAFTELKSNLRYLYILPSFWLILSWPDFQTFLRF